MFARLMGLKTISPAALQQLLRGSQRVFTVDVNSTQNWLKARVPGASHADPAAFVEADCRRARTRRWCSIAPTSCAEKRPMPPAALNRWATGMSRSCRRESAAGCRRGCRRSPGKPAELAGFEPHSRFGGNQTRARSLRPSSSRKRSCHDRRYQDPSGASQGRHQPAEGDAPLRQEQRRAPDGAMAVVRWRS